MGNYEDYIKLLKDLHYLCQEGKGQSEVANEIREMMEMCWCLLSEEQLEEIQHITKELFTTH